MKRKKKQVRKVNYDVLEQRKDSVLWQVMLADESLTLEQKDQLYRKSYALTNLVYILAEAADSCCKDLDGIVRKYKFSASHNNKMRLGQILDMIQKIRKNCANMYGDVAKVEYEKYINPYADIISNTSRLITDRINSKAKMHTMYRLLRTMENINGVFPELDKGRLTLD